ncbi:polysaccharide deacetylase family protein [Luteimonas saliphila]|uniref:polysaccharide deacetylase family protein n=1 Tax=Luteimonas saliphila TaxID=2804919 RepID=UPI00192D79B4|nr:polysaccharide deacetylase family protein [Luteimonas saliphila]
MKIASLMYHDVVAPGADDESGFPGPSAASYKLHWCEYEAQLARLAATGLRFPRVDDPRAFAPGGCLLTFDDGGASTLPAARRLDAHGMVGHFLITGARIGTPGFVTEADLRALAAAGHVVGSHSHTHPADISRLPATAISTEWRDSVQRLADVLGAPVEVASIPGGFYSREVAAAAIGCGIRYLFTSEPTTTVVARGQALLIGRYALQRDTDTDTVVAFARGTGTARQRQWLLWNIKKPAKRWAGPAYRWLRRRSFGGT